jgi:hypothetical protein
MHCMVCFPGVKRPGHEANHSSPSSAKVKNEWSYTSTPSVCLHGVDREDFILFYLYFYPSKQVSVWRLMRVIHSSFCSLSYDRSVVSSNACSPQGAI